MAMAEYIERETLIEELDKVPAYFESGDIRYGIQIAMHAVSKQPTADAVEVVRCEKCEYCKVSYPAKEIGKEAIEGYFCNLFQKYMLPTDFCSYGERKENT